MHTVAAHIELKSLQLKFEPSSKVWVAFLELRRHGEKEGVAFHGCRWSLALRGSAEAVVWAV